MFCDVTFSNLAHVICYQKQSGATILEGQIDSVAVTQQELFENGLKLAFRVILFESTNAAFGIDKLDKQGGLQMHNYCGFHTCEPLLRRSAIVKVEIVSHFHRSLIKQAFRLSHFLNSG